MYPSMFQGAEDFMSPMYPLAVDDVRFVGDPIALIIARSRYLAEDAAELVEIDYDDIAEPIIDYDTALAGDGTTVHPNRPVERRDADGRADERRRSRRDRVRRARGRRRASCQHRYSDGPDGVPRRRGALGAVRPAARRVDVEPEPARGAPRVLPRHRRAREPDPRADRRRRRRLRPQVVRRPRGASRSCSPRTSSARRSSGARTGARTSSRPPTHARRSVDVTLAVDADGADRRRRRRSTSTTRVRTPCGGGSRRPARRRCCSPAPYRVQHLGWDSTAIYTNTCGNAVVPRARG